jgi:hypothetical protein
MKENIKSQEINEQYLVEIQELFTSQMSSGEYPVDWSELENTKNLIKHRYRMDNPEYRKGVGLSRWLQTCKKELDNKFYELHSRCDEGELFEEVSSDLSKELKVFFNEALTHLEKFIR